MILSLFLSISSASFSWLILEPADEAPHICISISAKRCSTSHCCCANLALSEKFSVSTVWSRLRRRFISPSSASWEPKSGVASEDSSKCVRDSPWQPTKIEFSIKIQSKLLISIEFIEIRNYEIANEFQLPLLLGCDCGLEMWDEEICDAILLLGRSSELCTLGLIEPGESVILVRSVLLSLRCETGLRTWLLNKFVLWFARIIIDFQSLYTFSFISLFIYLWWAALYAGIVGMGSGDIHISSTVVFPFVSTRPGVEVERAIAT